MSRKEKIAYIFFLVSSFLLISLFVLNINREGYIVSEIKWTIYGLAIAVNSVFILVSSVRQYNANLLFGKQSRYTLFGVAPMILLSIYVHFTQ